MKNVFFAFFLFFMTSCNDSKIATEFSEPEIDSTLLNSDTIITNSKDLEIIVPENVDDKFETFSNFSMKIQPFRLAELNFH